MSEDEVVQHAGTSMMEALRRKHQELTNSQTLDMPMPGYEDLLVVRYRVLDVQKELNQINRKAASEFSDAIVAQLFGTMDAMARACVEIFGKRGDEIVPLAESIGPDAPPVRYNQALAEFMGWEDVTSARDVIMRLFANNEPMIMEHGQRLSRWMSNTTRRVNDSFLGEL